MKKVIRVCVVGFVGAISLLLLDNTILLASTVNPPASTNNVPEEFDVSKFYCKTRYGLLIEGEAARREACQKGFEGEDCPADSGEDEDGTIKACNEGRLAFKNLNPEPEAGASIAPTIATPEPPRLQAQSGTKSCGNVDTAFLSCNVPAAAGLSGSPLGALLAIILNLMAIGAGIVAVGAFVFAGMVYASSRDDSSQVKKAKDIIKNTTVGLVLFAALYAIVQFIVPGGVF